MSAPLTELFEEHTRVNIACQDGCWFIPSAEYDTRDGVDIVGTIEVSEPIMALIDAQRERIRVTLHELVEGCYAELCSVAGLYRLKPT